MSEINNVFSNNHFKQTYNRRGSLHCFLIAHNLYEATKEDIKTLLQCIDDFPESLDTTAITSLNTKDPWGNTNLHFLSALLCFRYDETSRAVEYMKKAIKINTNDNARALYQCCVDIMSINNNTKVYAVIETLYGKQVFKLAYNLLYSSQWLSYFNFSRCFDCAKCKTKKYCSLMPYAKLLKKIEIQYELNVPTQDLLQEVFY